MGFPSHPALMILDMGSLQSEPIYKDNKQGVLITKNHWLFGKTASQEIYAPEGAENIGIKAHRNQNPFSVHYWMSYELKGNKYLEHYKLSNNAKKSKFMKEYIWILDKQEWNELKEN